MVGSIAIVVASQIDEWVIPMAKVLAPIANEKRKGMPTCGIRLLFFS